MRIAIAGLGHVGAAALTLLQSNGDLLAARAGHPLTVVAVSARDRNKPRSCDLSGVEWVDDPRALAVRDDIDTVIEMIGGASGIAHDIATAALKGGKNLVTANKALIAAHGVELARLAEKADVQLSFEAAVCGAAAVLNCWALPSVRHPALFSACNLCSCPCLSRLPASAACSTRWK